MRTPPDVKRAARWVGGATGLAAVGWSATAAANWIRFGRVAPAGAAESDPLLDAFMPRYDVVERHHVDVSAPAAVTLRAACETDVNAMPLVRALFRGRELLLGAAPDMEHRPGGLLAWTQSLGWRVLAEVPGREVVVGAATRPWEANVTFRPVPPAQFAGFDEPGYVKIVWTLRADPLSASASTFRTETRVVATDAAARARFRRYWAWLSPGIVMIRRLMLEPVKAAAERRAGARRAA
jgi:hypothetical protein